MNTENDRDDFEDAFLGAGGKPYQLEKEDGEYTSSQAYFGWMMWKAAKLHEKLQLKGFTVVPEDQAKDTARLDFMLAKGRIISEKTNYNECSKPIATGLCVCDVYWIDGMDRLTESLHQTDREAIDAAMENHNA
ncbi:hypothetical protein J522_1900 [Acinetobacter baumannii 146457]|nr:hypothetical protein J522_1900 [Acinetobacter baumannii 146457]